MKRSCGVLLHITSLPSPGGIGTLGTDAFAFVDFLRKAGQSCWQMLPIGPIGDGDSPYMTVSTFAGNPYLIDLDLLRDQGLLDAQDDANIDWGQNPSAVEYPALHANRLAVLRKAYARGFAEDDPAFAAFAHENAHWLDDYALFMALRDSFSGESWRVWPRALRLREPLTLRQIAQQLKSDVDFYRYVQFLFFSQWSSLKKYANAQGIKLIGDIPIYVSMDGSDTWTHPELFRFDPQRNPTCVAGCPPDYFSATGQLWGNPLYDWDAHRSTNYRWWVERMRRMQTLFDVVRIDHFRGFESFYDIPFGDETAEHGVWLKGPGMELFTALRQQLGRLSILAEDLGDITPAVRTLLRKTGFPGMKVLQFAFDSPNSSYLPHAHSKNCVVYTGTHDNDTSEGFFQNGNPGSVSLAKTYLKLNETEGLAWGLIRGAYMSVANLAIVPMQDFLSLGSEARMNTPATPTGNWRWRVAREAFTDELAKRMHALAGLYGRC